MKKKKRVSEISVFREYFELLVETAIFVFFVMTFVVQAFQIPTGSMEKTLLIGDFLLVNKLAYAHTFSRFEKILLPQKKVQKNDIVVFKFPEDLTLDFVKRVVATEKDVVEIKEKQVYINGSPVVENFKMHIDSQTYSKDSYFNQNNLKRDNFGPVEIPVGYCLVLGDNRDNSQDSRYWGFLPLDNIKGKPWIIYFSYNAERNAYQKTSFRDNLKKLFRFFTKNRWRRMLHVVH